MSNTNSQCGYFVRSKINKKEVHHQIKFHLLFQKMTIVSTTWNQSNVSEKKSSECETFLGYGYNDYQKRIFYFIEISA